MDRAPVSLSPEALVAELGALLSGTDPSRTVLAFDGDGTLWSGDVGEDLFHAALREQYLLPPAQAELRAEAERHHIPLGAAHDSNEVARDLFAAYLAGQYPERETCAMMAWCYAGRSLSELSEFARRVVRDEGLAGRLNAELAPILDFAEQQGLRRVLISASPRVVVEAAGALVGFQPQDIAAATPALLEGQVQPRLLGNVPYAEAKLSAGRALFGDARWLAAFGDNVFDIDMLTAADRGIAVRPKPRLEARLAGLGLRVLERRGGDSRQSAR